MKRYLLDTNICIYLLKGKYDLSDKVDMAGLENCFISEITIAELKYGAANSEYPERNMAIVEGLIERFTLLPIYTALDIYAAQKAKLRKQGKPLDDFDLLIGATAIANNLVLVTHNVSDFERIDKIEIEDWAI